MLVGTVIVVLNAVGAVPQLKVKKFSLSGTATMSHLARYIHQKLKMRPTDNIVCDTPTRARYQHTPCGPHTTRACGCDCGAQCLFLNSAFQPAMDQTVGAMAAVC